MALMITRLAKLIDYGEQSGILDTPIGTAPGFISRRSRNSSSMALRCGIIPSRGGAQCPASLAAE
jgi:hypothetical protein